MDRNEPPCSAYLDKAEPPGRDRWRLLTWHALDVAGIAGEWLSACSSLRVRMARITGLPGSWAMAWTKFFVALHDLGKIDVRFQIKLPGGAQAYPGGSRPDAVESRNYWHGEYALYWAYHDLAARFDWKSDGFLCGVPCARGDEPGKPPLWAVQAAARWLDE
jgi:CRISPR-associated endonuclease/helicase Cas3